MEINKIYQGDTLEVLKTWPDEFVDCVVTSPPYWGLRDYGVEGQLGLEKTPEEYVAKMVEIFREVRRVLKKEGTLWMNLGDSYNSHSTGNGNVGGIEGKRKNRQDNRANINRSKDRTTSRWGGGQNSSPNLKDKDLVGIPWRVAFAIQADGWYLRQDIIWSKPNPMPESVTDRCTKSHEYVFLLAKNKKYYFDADAIKEPAIYGLHSKENRPPGIVRDRLYGYDSKEAKLRGRIINQTKNGVTIRHPNGKYGNKQQSPKTIVDIRNKRSVWTISTKPYSEAHFATFPTDLITPMIKAGCPENGITLDPFMGSGTTAFVARALGRNYLGIELNPKYIKLAEKRLAQKVLL